MMKHPPTFPALEITFTIWPHKITYGHAAKKSAVWGNRPLGPPRYTTELKYNTPLHTHTLQMFMLRHYLGN